MDSNAEDLSKQSAILIIEGSSCNYFRKLMTRDMSNPKFRAERIAQILPLHLDIKNKYYVTCLNVEINRPPFSQLAGSGFNIIFPSRNGRNTIDRAWESNKIIRNIVKWTENAESVIFVTSQDYSEILCQLKEIGKKVIIVSYQNNPLRSFEADLYIDLEEFKDILAVDIDEKYIESVGTDDSNSKKEPEPKVGLEENNVKKEPVPEIDFKDIGMTVTFRFKQTADLASIEGVAKDLVRQFIESGCIGYSIGFGENIVSPKIT